MKKKYLQKLSNIYILLVAFSIFPMLFFTTLSILQNNKTSYKLLQYIIPYVLFWVALEVLADLRPFRIVYHHQMEMTMSFAVQLSAVILLGTAQAIWITVVATLMVEIYSKKRWDRVLFNAGQYGLSLLVTGTMFHLLKLSPGTLDIVMDLPAILVAVSAYFLLNTFFISTVISLTTGNRFLDVFFVDFKLIASYFYTLAPISIAVSLLYLPERPYVILIMIPPLIMADQALRRYYSLYQETQKTLKVLADTIDERDRYTAAHSIHVSEYARKIAQRLGLSLEEITEIEMAGQVHDLGKVGIEDNILRKNGKLSDEEYLQIKNHSEIAYRLLKNLTPYKKGADYVLYHHEHFDGSGYPKKLTGKSIPMGARILTVADSYDAMTTDRPYRKALPQSTAANELKTCSGTQFDPEVVQAFITILKSDYGYQEEEQKKCL